MIQFVLKLPGTTRYTSRRCSDFVYVKKHDAHIYKGKEFPIDELDSMRTVITQYKDYFAAGTPYPSLVPAETVETGPIDPDAAALRDSALQSLSEIEGTGENGTITILDVELALESVFEPSEPTPEPTPEPTKADDEEVKETSDNSTEEEIA